MNNPVIKVENISKQYRLGNVGTGTVKDDINRWWHQVRGKEDPYLKIGETNDRTIKGSSDYVWALKDINFDVHAGEVLGIIGRNGAGKSTLLKILSRTTTPTTGSVQMKGRVASLLEVGTGFHPDLTGRENIYLNGAILGMRRQEINQKFDEIVDFAGIDRYIDTPVKRYSSGMYVRLAFAVAAHLDPEILIVDEVLAVGDAEFQKKCLGKMKDVSANEGRTVLFVSHNLVAIKNLCKKAILLQNGNILSEGKLDVVINNYLKVEQSYTHRQWHFDEAPGSIHARLMEIEVVGRKEVLYIDEPLDIRFKVKFAKSKRECRRINFSLVLASLEEVVAFNVGSDVKDIFGDEVEGICHVPANLLNDENYIIRLLVVEDSSVPLFDLHRILDIKMEERNRDSSWHGKWIGLVRPQQLITWSIR